MYVKYMPMYILHANMYSIKRETIENGIENGIQLITIDYALLYYITDTFGQGSLLYRGVLHVEVILCSKECNWYTRCCPLNGGVRYRECPLREAVLTLFINSPNIS